MFVLNDIGNKREVVLDPDNVFWAVMPKNENGGSLLPREVLSQYEKMKDKLDKELQEFRFSSSLTSVYINPTDRCNANCPYCYIPARIRKYGRSMTAEELEYIFDKIAGFFKDSAKRPVIIFHASEPLLVKDMIFKAIAGYKDRFHFGLQTNAVLLKKEDVDFLTEHNVGVGISLDSFMPKINNRLRYSAKSGGNFSKAVKAIESFQGYDGLNIITTVTKQNVTHLPGLVEFLHAKKVSSVLLNPIRTTQRGARTLCPDEKLLTKYFIKAVDRALELSKNSKHRIIISNFTNIILAIIAPAARRLMCDISPCGGGRCFLTITPSGDMIPCGEFIGLAGFSGGNIFNNSISEAMESPQFKKVRARVVEEIADCKECAYRNICGAPCPAELHSRGNMDKKAIFCEFYKEIIRYAFELISKKEEKYLLRPNALKNLKYEYIL